MQSLRVWGHGCCQSPMSNDWVSSSNQYQRHDSAAKQSQVLACAAPKQGSPALHMLPAQSMEHSSATPRRTHLAGGSSVRSAKAVT
jgi:hypothetical protein